MAAAAVEETKLLLTEALELYIEEALQDGHGLPQSHDVVPNLQDNPNAVEAVMISVGSK